VKQAWTFETLFGGDRKAKRDANFFKIAEVISDMATCLRAKHGAVIVNKDHRIVCTGYNGSLPGHPHCSDVGCDVRYLDGIPHCHRTIHAERNALTQAAKYGIAVEGCRIYVTGEPCEECAKHLAAAGVAIVPIPS
jgi:dCMP deaminase